MQHLKHTFADDFSDSPPLSNARCRCTEYYKYLLILPQHHTWLEIQNSITKIRDTTLAFLNLYQLYIFFFCLACIAHCKFYTLINHLLFLWHKYLESLGKNNVFTHVFFAVYYGGRTLKRTITQ